MRGWQSSNCSSKLRLKSFSSSNKHRQLPKGVTCFFKIPAWVSWFCSELVGDSKALPWILRSQWKFYVNAERLGSIMFQLPYLNPQCLCHLPALCPCFPFHSCPCWVEGTGHMRRRNLIIALCIMRGRRQRIESERERQGQENGVVQVENKKATGNKLTFQWSPLPTCVSSSDPNCGVNEREFMFAFQSCTEWSFCHISALDNTAYDVSSQWIFRN